LKVGFYTSEFEQLFRFSAVALMFFFISHIICQNFLKILQKQQGSHRNGSISAPTRGCQHYKYVNNQPAVTGTRRKGAYFGFIIFSDTELMPNASTVRMQNAPHSKQTRPPLPLTQKATNSTNASTINHKSQKQQEGQY
jgi:hypothetical protein